MTRKRLWKDASGNIVVKRPALGQRPSNQQEQTTASSSSRATGLPLSPPGSASSIEQTTADILSSAGAAYEDSASQQPYDFPLDAQLHESSTNDLFWESALPAAYDSAFSTELFDDIFLPDTASSFNMPYTTQNNYNWLFDLSASCTAGELQPKQSHMPIAPMAGTNICTEQPLPSPTATRSSSSTATDYGNIGTLPVSGNRMSTAERPEQGIGGKSAGFQSHADHRATTHSDNAQQHSSMASISTMSQPSEGLMTSLECPLSLLDPQTRLPGLDELSRERVMELVERASPKLPDGSTVVSDNPLLSLSSLQSYLDLFFTRFNTSYPLIHLATFEPNEVDPILLLTILLLGATYADKTAHQLAVCIHDVLRPQIFADPGFSAKPDIWVLQSILLTECLGKSRAGQKQHDMSHLFHGMLINLIRRSDCQTAQPDTSVGSDEDLDKCWRDWADLEQKKRLAQICFVMVSTATSLG